METPMDKPAATTEETKSCCGHRFGSRSRKFRIIAGVIGLVLIMLISFAAGVGVGLRKARFSYSWGQNYERNFLGGERGRGGMMGFVDGRGPMMGQDFRNGYGLAGTILSITDNNLVVKDRDNKENTVAVTDKTLIKAGRNDLKISDLKVNDQIVVMGAPGDSGVINAALIRVFNGQNN